MILYLSLKRKNTIMVNDRSALQLKLDLPTRENTNNYYDDGSVTTSRDIATHSLVAYSTTSLLICWIPDCKLHCTTVRSWSTALHNVLSAGPVGCWAYTRNINIVCELLMILALFNISNLGYIEIWVNGVTSTCIKYLCLITVSKSDSEWYRRCSAVLVAPADFPRLDYLLLQQVSRL